MSKIVCGGILLLTLTTAVLCPLGLKEMQARAAGVDTCAAAIAVATNRWKDAAAKGIPALDNQLITFPQCLQRLGTELILGLPAAVVSSPSVLDALNKLSEPSCDHQAMLNLGDALRNAGYKDKALSVAMIYGVSCPGYRSFNVASGSMKPSLLLGDYLLVSKYNSSQPQRGDVVAFRLPKDDSTVWIKRLVGLPGDHIQMKDGLLYINGTAVERERVSDFLDDENGAHVRRWRETLPNGASYETMDIMDRGILDNTQEYIVPPDNYFVIGDNRDNSVDSRVLSAVGYVPVEKLIGVVEIIWMSVKPNSPEGQAAIRSDRVGLTLLQGSGARQRGRPQRTRRGRSPT